MARGVGGPEDVPLLADIRYVNENLLRGFHY